MATRITKCSEFMTVWIGQTISTFGLQMTGFALSIWTFHQSNSVIAFGLVIAAQLGPALVFSPFAGVLIDRYDRKKMMVICDIGMFCVCLVLLGLTLKSRLDINYVVILSPIMAFFAMIHNISYSSSISQLVPRDLYGSANSLVQIGVNVSAVIVPVVTVLIVELYGIQSIMKLNLFCCAFSLISLLLIKFPIPLKKIHKNMSLPQLIKQQKYGFTFLFYGHNTALISLLMVLCTVIMLNGFVQVLFRPMILASLSQEVVGWLVAIAGVGGLVGAIFSGIMIKDKNRKQALIVFSYCAGFASIFCGFLPKQSFILAITAFVFSFSIPVVMISSQTFWQKLVPAEVQGKVFAIRTFLSSAVLMLTLVLVPLVSEKVIEPLITSNVFEVLNTLSVDTGAGAMGLMFIIGGIISVLATSVIWGSHSFSLIHTEVQQLKVIDTFK